LFANTKKPIWENIPNAVQTINATTFLQTPSNLHHCHNLCKKLQPPTGDKQLLGLGLNFCIGKRHPKPNVKNTLEKLKRSIRLQAWIKENGAPTSGDYIPKLYIPSPWKPPPAPDEVENNLLLFSSKIQELVRNNKTIPRSNLSKLQ
jgi:hypothetical protein